MTGVIILLVSILKYASHYSTIICTAVLIASFLQLEVGIKSFSLPVTELNYPAITICKENGFYDPGEYVRAIFNNFQYTYEDGDGSCETTALLRQHYKQYIGEGSCKNDSVHFKLDNPLYVTYPQYATNTPKYVWIESLMHGLHIWDFRLPK